MYISVYVCANKLSLGQRSVMNNLRYNCGYASYIDKYYIECGAEYSVCYYRLYNVDQLVTYGVHKGCKVYVAEVNGYIYTNQRTTRDYEI